MQETLSSLLSAAAGVEPFDLTLDALGTFGGRTRGVLWAGPSDHQQLQALVALQAALQAAVPGFDDQQRVGGSGFVPHMTLSHFDSLEEAEAARDQLRATWVAPTFRVGGLPELQATVHLIWRDGSEGQFKRAASLHVGSNPEGENLPLLLDPPCAFAHMPRVEEEWVLKARLAGKKQWKKRKGGQRSRSPRRSPEERAAIAARTPEEIEEIRAARAAKKKHLLSSNRTDSHHV
mgnify:CR=1 FL=1